MCGLPGVVAKGYLAVTRIPAGCLDFELHKKMKEHILDKGLSDLKDPKSSAESTTVRYCLDEAIVTVEAIRNAQAEVRRRPITGEKVQWSSRTSTSPTEPLADRCSRPAAAAEAVKSWTMRAAVPARCCSWDGGKENSMLSAMAG